MMLLTNASPRLQQSEAALLSLSRPPAPSLSLGFKLKGKLRCLISLFPLLAQVRRKALQEEIDRESGKTEPSETGKWTVS